MLAAYASGLDVINYCEITVLKLPYYTSTKSVMSLVLLFRPYVQLACRFPRRHARQNSR